VVEISVDSSLAGGGSDMTVNAASSTGNKNSSMQKRQLRERESTITSFLTRLVVPHAVDYRGLVISPGKYVWRLCVDIVILRCDGCVLDACAMAVREGLRSTLLPRVSAVGGRSNDDDGKGDAFRGGGGSSNNDLIVEGDIRKALPPPGAEECPLVVTLSILSAPQDERIRHFCIVDARTEEEVCASSRVCVSVDPNGMVCGVHTLGGGGIDDEEMNDEFGVEGFGISSSSMPMNMLNEVVNTAAGAAKNLYRLLDSERIAGDSKAKDDGSGYGYLFQNQLIIQ
jgi:exosome complex RNA-binding protein Rrp42 (RNase PH superfamily)